MAHILYFSPSRRHRIFFQCQYYPNSYGSICSDGVTASSEPLFPNLQCTGRVHYPFLRLVRRLRCHPLLAHGGNQRIVSAGQSLQRHLPQLRDKRNVAHLKLLPDPLQPRTGRRNHLLLAGAAFRVEREYRNPARTVLHTL